MSETKKQALKSDLVLGQELIDLPQNDVLIPPPIDSPAAFKAKQQGVYDQLNQFFSEQDKGQKIVLEAREILGESASLLTDEQVYDLVNEMQYLVETWVEEFERNVFDGKTLKELVQLDI